MTNIYWIVLIIAFGYILSRRMVFSKDVKNVTAEQAHNLIKENKELVIIDVRTRPEYKSGHIAKAKSIPVHELSSKIGELERFKEKSILVHCASGGRSPGAVKILLKHGFKDIYHMNSGLLKWSYGLKES
jgi:rhodanese-related sulfurtransferase